MNGNYINCQEFDGSLNDEGSLVRFMNKILIILQSNGDGDLSNLTKLGNPKKTAKNRMRDSEKRDNNNKNIEFSKLKKNIGYGDYLSHLF